MWRRWRLESIPSAISGAAAVTGWYDKVKELFTDFKPETRSMSINFSHKTSQIGFKITVPDGWRKSSRKIIIPAYNNYKILRMTDESFIEQKYLWERINGNYVLKADKVPNSENFLIEMEGNVDENVLKNFVYIKPAINRDNDDQNDKYWLESSIKKPGFLETIYSDLEIDEVNFGVNIDIDKMFGLTIPKEVKEKSNALQHLLKVSSRDFDRNKLINAAVYYKRQEKLYPSFNPGDFFRIIQKFTAKNIIRDYIKIDQSYNVGDVEQPEKYNGVIPQNLKVHAITRLTLRDPIARGYLIFNRESYMKKLRDEFKNLKI